MATMREQLEAKYGTPTTTSPAVPRETVKPAVSVRAQLEAKYKKPKTYEEKSAEMQSQGQAIATKGRFNRTGEIAPSFGGQIVRGIAKIPVEGALTVARGFGGLVNKGIREEGLTVKSKFLGDTKDYATSVQDTAESLADRVNKGEISKGRAVLGVLGASAEKTLDLASVIPAGTALSAGKTALKQGAKGIARERLIPATKTALKRSGSLAGGYDIASQAKEGEGYNPLRTVGAVALGTVADVGVSNVLPRVVSRGTRTQRDIARTEKELLNIENNYQKLRKNAKFSKDGNSATRSRVAKSGVLSDVVDPTGTIITDNAVKRYRDLSGLNKTEGVVRNNLERLGETIDLNTLEQKLKATIYRSGLQGANLRSALNNVDNEIAGYRLRVGADNRVPLTLVHDAKIDTYNSIDFNTPSEIKQYKKLLARGLKESVEESSSFNVKQVNDELTPLLKDVEYLESLNGRKVKGGKLGKYSARIAGNIAGGIAGGSVGGLGGSAVGTVVGGEIGDTIQGRVLRNTFGRTPLTNLPESEILKKAVITGNSPRLQLPAPAKNTPRVILGSGRTINLPSRTQTTIDAQSLANLKAQKIAPPSKMPSKVSIPEIISEKKTKGRQYDANGTPIIRDAKGDLPSLADPQEGDIFYHGTKKVNKESLLKNGIDTKLNKKGYAEQAESFYVGDKSEAGMYGDDVVGVRVKKGSNVKTLDMASKEWREVVGNTKNNQESAQGLRELRKRGYDAVNHGDEIEILNPEKFEVFEINKSPKKKLPTRKGKGLKKDRLTEINEELKSLPLEGGDTLRTAQKKAYLESERKALYRVKSKLSNPLIQEAKKYKNAGEFVKAQMKKTDLPELEDIPDKKTYAEKLGFKVDKDTLAVVEDFWAKESTPNQYFHIGTEEIMSFDKSKSRFDPTIRGGGITQINGMYLGRDPRALGEFYGMIISDDLGQTPVVSSFKMAPKWLDLSKRSDESKFLSEVSKKYGIKAGRTKEFGDALEKEVIARGFDGVRYFDPYATGEEFVLVKEPPITSKLTDIWKKANSKFPKKKQK